MPSMTNTSKTPERRKGERRKTEHRKAVWRRQFNQSFMDEHGNVMVGKVMAVATQTVVLFYMTRDFELLYAKPETMLIILSFLVAPQVIGRLAKLKYGNGATK